MEAQQPDTYKYDGKAIILLHYGEVSVAHEGGSSQCATIDMTRRLTMFTCPRCGFVAFWRGEGP